MTKVAKTPYEEAVPADRKVIGGFEVKKVVREFVPMYEGGSQSFGQCLDETLVEAARNGEEVQSLTLEISSQAWAEYAELVRR